MKAIIFGAGKIARGFIGHLLYLSHIPFILVDINPVLVDLLNKRKSYRVHIMGNPERSADIKQFNAILLSDTQAIAREWADADIGFISVGGKNLTVLAEVLAEAYRIRCKEKAVNRHVHLITCENWKEPAALLKQEIRNRLSGECLESFDRWVGIAESAVMRSGVESAVEMLKEDPLCIQVSDYWELPVDREALPGDPVKIQGVKYIEGFSGFLERKFYTYNAANATVSYLGYLRGHEYLYNAATDPEIVRVLQAVYAETGAAFVRKYGIARKEQNEFANSSLKKLQDACIVDYVERNARDPIRKLSPDDRLVGSARLVLEYGGTPSHLALSIAAAIHYDHPKDPIALELMQIRKEQGIEWIMQNICQLRPDGRLFGLVKEKVSQLQQWGWIS